jgi:NadR type nicotinamide-nucleotide adenylyltransferase
VFVKKIVIIGGESTGKSTLCEQLATVYNTVFVQEYAREYLQTIQQNYTYDDLLNIAKKQIEIKEDKIKLANKLMFIDTNLQVIQVWSEHKYNKVHPWILNTIAKQTYDCYIITSPDIAWQDDPLREHPEPAMRNYFFNLYKELIIQSEKPFTIVHGNEANRLLQAKTFISTLF